jgi:hypothetical protein
MLVTSTAEAVSRIRILEAELETEYNRFSYATAEKVIEIGRHLSEIRRNLAPDEIWKDCLTANLPEYDERKARRYLLAYKNQDAVRKDPILALRRIWGNLGRRAKPRLKRTAGVATPALFTLERKEQLAKLCEQIFDELRPSAADFSIDEIEWGLARHIGSLKALESRAGAKPPGKTTKPAKIIDIRSEAIQTEPEAEEGASTALKTEAPGNAVWVTISGTAKEAGWLSDTLSALQSTLSRAPLFDSDRTKIMMDLSRMSEALRLIARALEEAAAYCREAIARYAAVQKSGKEPPCK